MFGAAMCYLYNTVFSGTEKMHFFNFLFLCDLLKLKWLISPQTIKMTEYYFVVLDYK